MVEDWYLHFSSSSVYQKYIWKLFLSQTVFFHNSTGQHKLTQPTIQYINFPNNKVVKTDSGNSFLGSVKYLYCMSGFVLTSRTGGRLWDMKGLSYFRSLNGTVWPTDRCASPEKNCTEKIWISCLIGSVRKQKKTFSVTSLSSGIQTSSDDGYWP